MNARTILSAAKAPKARTAYGFVGLWALTASACSFADPLAVEYSSPEGQVSVVPRWVEVRFAHPIVDPDVPNAEARGLKFSIQPRIGGEIRYPAPNALAFEFAEPVPPAQTFTVTVAKGLRSADGKYALKDDHVVTFNSGLNGIAAMRRLDPASGEAEDFPLGGERRLKNLDLRDRLLVELEYPASVAQLKEKVSVRGEPMSGGEPRSLEFDLAFPNETNAGAFMVIPDGNWPKHTHLHVDIAAGLGVSGVPAGPLTTPETISRRASTYGPIEIVSGPVCQGCRPPSTFMISFSTPVECEKAIGKIRVRPARERLRCATQPHPTTIRVEPVPAFEGHTDYKIIVRKGVVDVFGQELKTKTVFELSTGDPNPRFAHQKIFNVLERKQGGAHEEKVYRTHQLRVNGARLTFAEAWKVIAAADLSDQVAWKELPYWISNPYYGYFEPCHWDDELEEEVCDGSGADAQRYPGSLDTDELVIPGAKESVVDVTPPSAGGPDGDEGDGDEENEEAAKWAEVQVPLDPYLEGHGGVAVLKITPLGRDGHELSTPVLRILNVTDIGLSAKYSPNRLVVLAATLADGKPIEGADVRVFVTPESGEELAEPAATGTTDELGVAVFGAGELAAGGATPDLHRQGLFVAVRKGDDEAFTWSKFNSGGRRASNDGPNLVGSVYTERGVYRPGETVFYRVVARSQTATGFATPSGKLKVVAKLGSSYDSSDDDAIFETEGEFSEFGTIHGQFEVPADARIGDYSLVAKVGDQRLAGDFKVAEFRRAEMKVTVATNEKNYVRGETMQVQVNADYLFGAPAAGLGVRYSLRRNWDYFSSKLFPQARFTDYSYHSWYDERSDYSEFLEEEEAVLDDEGSLSFEYELDTPGSRGKLEQLVVSATVDDESGQSVSNRTTVRVHPADFHVGIVPRGYLKEKGRMFTYEVVAVTPEDKPVEGVAITVSSHQDYWYSVKRKGSGGRMYWTYEREEIHLDDVCAGKTNAQGKLTCQLTPEKGGDIRLRAAAKDEKNREVRASSWFWIVGDPSYYGGRSDRANQVSLISEAPELKAGEKARVAITSPFQQGLALVTVEREDILWQRVMEVGSNEVLELDVDPSWAPNVYISATVVRGRVTPEGDLEPDPERDKPAFALGYLNLTVEPTQNVLEVAVSTDEPIYEPGKKVTATVSVEDSTGRGVASEVNLYAVDEGVLMLTRYRMPDVIGDLFVERPYAVLAMDTRMHVLGRRVYVTPVIKGEEDGGGGGADQGEELRRDFNPVAVWVGDLKTDDSGKATKSFELPDTLTTYRLMAVAVTREDRFGTGKTEFKTQKTLMMRQAMPRFARPGDRFDAGVVVNQLSGKNQKVTVSIETLDEKLFKIGKEKTLTQQVGAKETVAFRFPFEAFDVDGASEVIFAAKMGEFGDRVQLVLPVRRVQARESRSISGVVEKGSTSHTMSLPSGARPVELEFNVSGLPVAQLEQRIQSLVGYPYGCLEQRTSKVMPLIAVRKLAEELNFASIPTDKIKKWVEEWVSLVPKYRCPDDGFDYYPGCRWDSNEYLTAYAVDGLLTARKFGYEVPDELIDRPARYLEKRIAQASREKDNASLAGVLRVLAEVKRSKPAWENVLYEARSGLPLFAKTDLVRAIYRRTSSSDARIATLMEEISSAAVRRAGGLRFKASNPDRYWWAWDSNLRSTALVLRTLLQVEPTDARVPLIVKGLVELDGEQTYYATQGLTQTLLGLAEASEVLSKTGKKPVATIAVSPKGKSEAKLFDATDLGQKVQTAKLGGEALGDGPYEVAVANSGNGPLYFGGFLKYAYPATARLPAKNDGFRIERTYTDKQGKDIGGTVRVGDYVLVQLQVWPDESGRVVVVDDPLPAGLEPVDTSLDTSDTEMAEVMENRPGDWGWWRSRYREMRDDRTEWHFKQVYAYSGRYPMKLQYLTRAATAGRFYAPGTTAERMYQPHIRGRGKGYELVVKPKK